MIVFHWRGGLQCRPVNVLGKEEIPGVLKLERLFGLVGQRHVHDERRRQVASVAT